MPNIFKQLRKSAVTSYIFPKAEELEDDLPAAQESGEPEREEDSPAEAENAGAGKESGARKESEAEQAIGFAAVQAQKIVEDAEQRAQELVQERLREAEAEIENAREEAKAEGYRQGYAEGLSKASVEAKANLDSQLQAQAEEIADFLKKATLAREEMIRETRSELCELSVAIAEKVIHISLKSSSEVIARMIQVVTEKMKRREWVHIYVGGCDAPALAEITPELTVALASLSDHIRIIPMADDESGTCIIEMPDEIIDASVSTQLQNIRDIIHAS